jgi:predicted Rossmann fold flavoprotein
LSGPAILQASSYWQPGAAIEIDLLPGIDIAGELRARRNAPRAVLGQHLPKRLADRWIDLHPIGTMADREIDAISAALHEWRVIPGGTEGYEKAEVTAGGVDTSELSSQTMEARRVPGLYFIGEAVDVTGQLGGFNFQWAWASGFAASQAV